MSARYRFTSYVATGALARAGTESAGPALLISAAAVGVATRRGALLVAGLTASAALGGPIVGVLIDRARRPAVAYALGLVTMAAGLGLLAAGIRTWPLGPLMLAGLLAGLAAPLFSGGWTAQLSALVRPGRLRSAYAIDSMTYDVGGMAGPALAGAAVVISATAPVIVSALLFLAALPILFAVRIRGHQEPVERRSVRRDVSAGLRTVAQQPALRGITVLSTLQLAGMAGRTVAAPLISQRLTGGSGFAGLLLAASAAASLLSGLALARRPLQLSPDRVAVLSTVGTALTVGLLSLPAPLWTVVVLFGVGGLVESPLLVSVFEIREREAPERLRAQVFTTAASMKTSAYALGVAGFGALATVGVGACVLGGAALQLLGVFAMRVNQSAVDGCDAP